MPPKPRKSALCLGGLSADSVGSNVRVTILEGSKVMKYEGLIHSIELNNGRLTLEKITSLTTGKQMKGIQHYFNYEIQNLEVISDNRIKAEKKKENTDGPLLVGRKQSNAHLRKLKPLDNESLLLKSEENTNSKKIDCVDEGPKITRVKTVQEAQRKMSPDQLSHQRWPEHYIVINQNNNVFKEALIHIQQQTVIGIAFEGSKLGRHGTISFIQVGTRAYVFIFDVLALGRTLFDEGLKGILEHSKVQKVMDDCRWVSDALFHQYGVRLRSVFDTQVAGVICYRNMHNGRFPTYVQGINILLVSHLNFPSNHTYFYTQRETVKSDEKVWLSRPAPERMIKIAMRRVMYLLALRASLLEAMLIDFTDGVDIYLGCVRDAPEDKVTMYERHRLPFQFRDMHTEANAMRQAYERRYEAEAELENMAGPNGFRENCIGSLNTSVIYSNDSVWHQGSGKHISGGELSRTQLLEECHRKGTYFMSQKENQKDLHRAYELTEFDRQKEISKNNEEEPMLVKNKVTAEPARPGTGPKDKETIHQVPSTMYVPAGCPVSAVEFVSRDIRVMKPDVMLDDDSNDAIPSHRSLVKSDPTRHKPTPGLVRPNSSPVKSPNSNGISPRTNGYPNGGISGSKKPGARGRGIIGQANQLDFGPGGDEGSANRKMGGVRQVADKTPPKMALGRSKLLQQMLANQRSSSDNSS